MELFQRIMTISPEITERDFQPGGCIRLEDAADGKGAFIASWSHPTLPEPTADQLAALEVTP
jgi:hypothetical protein